MADRADEHDRVDPLIELLRRGWAEALRGDGAAHDEQNDEPHDGHRDEHRDEHRGEHWSETDERTRLAIERLRRAWVAESLAPGRLPWRLRLRHLHRAHRVGTWLVAAALVAVLAPALWYGLRTGAGSANGDAPATHVVADEPPGTPPPLRVAALSSEGLELRSGPVRLILVTRPSEGTAGLEENPSERGRR